MKTPAQRQLEFIFLFIYAVHEWQSLKTVDTSFQMCNWTIFLYVKYLKQGVKSGITAGKLLKVLHRAILQASPDCAMQRGQSNSSLSITRFRSYRIGQVSNSRRLFVQSPSAWVWTNFRPFRSLTRTSALLRPSSV